MKLQFDDDGDGWIILAIVIVIVAGSIIVAVMS